MHTCSINVILFQAAEMQGDAYILKIQKLEENVSDVTELQLGQGLVVVYLHLYCT